MDQNGPFESLLLLTLLAVSVPIVLRLVGNRLRIPIVVGEIVAGMAVGPSGLGWLHESSVIAFLGEFGFIFLMFLSGLELDFSLLNSRPSKSAPVARWRRPAALACLHFGLTLILAGGAGLGLQALGLTRSPELMGLILCTTSLGIVVPVLKERRLTARPYGQMLLVAALLADFVTLLLLGFVITIETKGFGIDLLLFVVLLVVFVFTSRIGRWATESSWARKLVRELSHPTAQIRIRFALALIVLWVVLAESLGVDVILGAFLAGAALRQTSKGSAEVFEQKLDAIGYGFFIPIFFLLVGARVDFGAIAASGGAIRLVLLLIVISYLVKFLPALLFRAAFTWRETLAAGALLSSRLSLIIAASAIALELDLISTATNSAIVLVAVVTCTLSPTLFHRILPATKEQTRSGIVVLGTDSLAELLGTRLLHSGEPVTFIGADTARLERLASAGHRIVTGSPDDEATLAEAGAARARALVALSNDPAVVLRTCELAKERFEIPAVAARADSPELVRGLQELGVHVVQPSTAMALSLEGALLFPAALATLIDGSDEFDLGEAPLSNPDLFDVPLRQVHLPAKSLVLGIRRRGEHETLVPHGDTVLREGDVLMLSGHPQALIEAAHWISGR